MEDPRIERNDDRFRAEKYCFLRTFDIHKCIARSTDTVLFILHRDLRRELGGYGRL